jgi:hypothetical protein
VRRAVSFGVGFALAVLLAPAVGAQTSAVDSIVPAPHVMPIDAATVRPGMFSYATSLDHDTVSVPFGRRTVLMIPTSYAGVPAMLLLETRDAAVDSARDSLFVDPVSLAPMHWNATIGRANMAFEFRGDTAYGGTSAPTGKRSQVTTIPRGALINAAMLETTLRSLPLGLGFQDSTLTLSVNPNTQVLLPTSIAVIGRETVRVPAGAFDCWVVSVHAGDRGRGLYWVSTGNPVVVQSELDVGSIPGEAYVSRLVTQLP